MRHGNKLEITRDMDYKLELIRDMVTILNLYETWEKTWNYIRHGKKLEITRDMVTNLKL